MVYQLEVLAHDVDVFLRDRWKVYFHGKPEIEAGTAKHNVFMYAFGYLRGKHPDVLEWMRAPGQCDNIYFELEDDASLRATILRIVTVADDTSKLPVSSLWKVYEDGDLRQRGIV